MSKEFENKSVLEIIQASQHKAKQNKMQIQEHNETRISFE